MKKFEEIIDKLRASLKSQVTSDNAEALASLDKNIDEAVEAHKATENELLEAKSTIVKIVKDTSFKPLDNSKPNTNLDDNKSLDEIMAQELKKIK